jgi:CRP/FNR family transcriptional regulator, anaerobic regulatory protein
LPAALFYQLMGASPIFRDVVLDDYAKLLTSMFSLVDDLAFATVEQRLARRLLAEADADGMIAKTHRQIASDVGSVSEVVSRQLGAWESAGVMSLQRGQVQIINRAALAMLQAERPATNLRENCTLRQRRLSADRGSRASR